MFRSELNAIILPEAYTPFMEPINEDYPEALLQIGDRVLIDMILDNLVQSSVKKIYIVITSHQKEISDRAKLFKPFVEIHVFQIAKMSQIEALKYIFKRNEQLLTDGTTILISAPIVTNLNYLKLNLEQYNQVTEDQPLATVVM